MPRRSKTGAEIPPGHACFPQKSTIVEMKLDLKRLKFLPIFSSELHGRNSLHGVRWARLITLKEMSPVAFRKQYGYQKDHEQDIDPRGGG